MRSRSRIPSQIEEVASRFFDNPIVDNTPGTHDGVKYGGETSDRVLKVTTYFLIGGVGFVVLLTIASVLLISNTTRLSIFARRREVEIMRLVGATNWFIRWPFVMEGVFTGMMGAAGAAILVMLTNRFYHRKRDQQAAVPALQRRSGADLLAGAAGDRRRHPARLRRQRPGAEALPEDLVRETSGPERSRAPRPLPGGAGDEGQVRVDRGFRLAAR